MNSTYGFNGVPLYVSVELNRDGLEWPSLAVAQSVALRRLLGDARKYNPGEVLHVFTRAGRAKAAKTVQAVRPNARAKEGIRLVTGNVVADRP